MDTQLSSLKQLLTDGVLWPAEATRKNVAAPALKIVNNKTYQICLEENLENVLYEYATNNFARAHERQNEYVPFAVKEIDSHLPHQGLICGALHEWLYTKENGNKNSYPLSILTLLISNRIRNALEKQISEKLLVWIGKDCWPTPHLLQQILPTTFNFSKQCLFVDTTSIKTRNWCIETALASPAVAAVIADCSKVTLGYTRRFSIAARKSNALGFLLRPYEENKFLTAAVSRWHVTPLPSQTFNACWNLELVKIKGKRPLVNSWQIEIHEEIGNEPRKNNEKVSLHILSNVGHQPSAKKATKTANLLDGSSFDEQEQQPAGYKALL